MLFCQETVLFTGMAKSLIDHGAGVSRHALVPAQTKYQGGGN
ncbi:MAG: hypothetical protein WCS37_17830 [Chloroflexota bacterium]